MYSAVDIGRLRVVLELLRLASDSLWVLFPNPIAVPELYIELDTVAYD